MNRHFIHYVPRQINIRFPADKNSPWFADVQGLGHGFKKPAFHIARGKRGTPASDVKEGDTIWIVGQLHSPWGKLPPSLDSRIDVGEITNEGDRIRKYSAKPSSVWFPLTDGIKLLEKLKRLAQTVL